MSGLWRSGCKRQMQYCGMPYRNDMELYHLNEDRSEHYRHSSAKVRKAMAESEIPLPDRNKTTKKPEKKAAVRTTTENNTETERKKKPGHQKISGDLYWF